MKILHIVPTYFPAIRYGGPIIAIHELCKNQVSLGHEVSVYTTNVDGDSNLDLITEYPIDLDGVEQLLLHVAFRLADAGAQENLVATAARAAGRIGDGDLDGLTGFAVAQGVAYEVV